MEELKQIQCDDQCGFLVRSHDEKEVLDAARAHITNVHRMSVTDNDLRRKMTTVRQPVGSKS